MTHVPVVRRLRGMIARVTRAGTARVALATAVGLGVETSSPADNIGDRAFLSGEMLVPDREVREPPPQSDAGVVAREENE